MYGKIFTYILLVILICSSLSFSSEIKDISDTSKVITLYVGGTGPGNYSKTQDAIDEATNGDTVFVYSGIYYEHLLVDVSISLIGENKYTTIIDGTDNGHVIQVIADNVNIFGFTIQNGTDWPYKGIIVESEYVNISNNNFKDLYYCLYISGYGNNVVYNNSFSKIITSLAISVEESNYNKIIRNTVSNLDAAIIVWESHNNNISENLLYSNGISIQVTEEGNNLIKNNIILTDWEGIELYSSNNIVINNTVSANDLALHLRQNNNQILHNDIYGDIHSYDNYNNTIMFNNIYGLMNFDFCSNNHNIINNTFVNSSMHLFDCQYNNISNNVFINGGIFSWYFSCNNTISNNLVNGKPLVYLENESDIAVAPNAGQVVLVNCSNITIENQNLSNTHVGLNAWDTDNCSIINNVISNNYMGIYLGYSNNNIVTGNNLISNTGIPIHSHMFSDNNYIYHNNFINNTDNSYDQCNNLWDNDYPSGGNYWDDYTGIDSDGDSIGDTPYPIPGGTSQDNYPLMHPHGLISELPGYWCFISPPTNISTNVDDILVLYDDTFYSYQEAIYNGIISPFIFSWNSVSQSYEFADVLNPGYGYWIYAYKNCELWTLYYERNFDDFISHLEPKWNSLGIEFDYDISKYDVLVNGVTWSEAVTDGIISDYVFGWDRTTQSYTFSDTFQPGYAYWVYAYQPCILKTD